MAGAGAALYGAFGKRRAWAFAQSPNIRKFVTTLPGWGLGANNIGQHVPLATKTTATFAGLSTDVYNLGVAQFRRNDASGPFLEPPIFGVITISPRATRSIWRE